MKIGQIIKHIATPGPLLNAARLKAVRAALRQTAETEHGAATARDIAELIYTALGSDGRYHSAILWAQDRRYEATLNTPGDMPVNIITAMIQEPAQLDRVQLFAVSRPSGVLTILRKDGTYSVHPRRTIEATNPNQEEAALLRPDVLKRIAAKLIQEAEKVTV